MSQLYSAGADTTGEAYVDIRVCDLIIQQSKIPKGVGSDFQIDGLYVVLRCQGEVRRTSCLWPSASGACSTELQRSAVPLAGAAGAYEEQSEEDLVWSELFRFIVPPALPLTSSATSRGGPHSPPSADGGNSQGGFCAPGTPPMHSAAAQQQSPGCGNSTIATETEINNAPLLHPAIELELWRSTRLSENLLGQYTYHVPMELMQSGYPLGNLDAVVERVVLLHTKEAPSIMGNLYGWNGHRLSLRLRVQAVGLAPLLRAWSPQQGSKAMITAMNTISSGAYPVPFPTAMLSGTVAGVPPYAPAGVYGTPVDMLNPVPVNFLAPVGASTGGGMGAGHFAPGMMMAMHGGMAVDNLYKPGQPPLFSMLPPASEVHASVGGRMFDPHMPGMPPATPPSSGQGILGDGDLTWQSSTPQPTVYTPYPLPHPS